MPTTAEHAPARSHSLTRRDVARRLGVSVSTVRRMEGQALHPIQDERGVWRFSDAEVRKMGQARGPRLPISDEREDGDLAARVFVAFSNGFGLREIVTELRVHPTVVRDLYSQWSTGLQAGERQRREAVQQSEQAREDREWQRWRRPK